MSCKLYNSSSGISTCGRSGPDLREGLARDVLAVPPPMQRRHVCGGDGRLAWPLIEHSVVPAESQRLQVTVLK